MLLTDCNVFYIICSKSQLRSFLSEQCLLTSSIIYLLTLWPQALWLLSASSLFSFWMLYWNLVSHGAYGPWPSLNCPESPRPSSLSDSLRLNHSLGLDQWGQINHLTWGQNYQIKPRGLRILYMHEDICDLCLSFVPDRTQFETRKSRWKTEWLFTVLTIPSTWGHPWQLWLRNDHFLPDNSF